MPDDQRTIPITKGRPHLVTQRPPLPPPPPLADRRFGERRKPLPPVALDKIFWPFAVGLCLGMLAPEVGKLAQGLGDWAERLVFPFSLLAARPEFGYGASAARILSTIALYLQFPLEGALTAFNLRRNIRLGKTVRRLAVAHAVMAILLWLLERPHTR